MNLSGNENGSLVWMYVVLLMWILLWAGFNFWAFFQGMQWSLDALVILLASLSFIGIFCWLIYLAILGKKVLPKIDRLVYPERTANARYPDNLKLKILRLNEYAAAITSKRARRLNPLPVDLRQLPDHLRIPVVAYIHWLSLCVLVAVVGMGLVWYQGSL